MCYNPNISIRKMINLDERYHDYLGGKKKFRIDDKEEQVKAYGWNCDGNDITGYYVLTENYILNYNMNEVVQKVEPR